MSDIPPSYSKSYIPHRILIINDQINESARDKTLSECYRLAFDWANKMGSQGKKVFDLYLQKPDYDKDPMNMARYILWCKIECTIEERKLWEEQQKLNFENAFWNALTD